MTAHHIVPVVLSGGSGARLWPLSTDPRPKPFHVLTGRRTLIQDTVLRMTGSARAAAGAPVVICGARHRDLVHAQLGAAGVAPAAVVLEPVGRNTAPAAAIAALLVDERAPGALVLLAPADHLIEDPAGFWRAVELAAPAAAAGRIVAFGVRPTEAATGYGYIRTGAPLGEGVFAVERFCEKPDRAAAERYLRDGRHLWNAGVLLFSPEIMRRELAAHRPDVLAHAENALAGASRQGLDVLLDPEAFARLPDVSIDYAVMEPTRASAVAPCDVGWADLGSWAELWRRGDRDGDGNLVRGETAILDARDCLVWSDGRPVAVVGARDLVVVATADGVLVARRDRAEEVKPALDRLRARPDPAPAEAPAPV